jgi:hypothetical protein
VWPRPVGLDGVAQASLGLNVTSVWPRPKEPRCGLASLGLNVTSVRLEVVRLEVRCA